MGRIIKWLFYLLVLAGLFLVAYAYVGPFLGVDFSAQPETTSVPVGLGLN
jgi:hypothetical protein